jgi:hypothetical protein
MSCVPAVLWSTDGTEGMISALSTPTPRLLIWKHGEKTRLRYYPRAPTASAWASRVVFIPSSSVSASTLNNHFNMAELVALRVHIPQIEGAQAPLVCTIFPARYLIGPIALGLLEPSQRSHLLSFMKVHAVHELCSEPRAPTAAAAQCPPRLPGGRWLQGCYGGQVIFR